MLNVARLSARAVRASSSSLVVGRSVAAVNFRARVTPAFTSRRLSTTRAAFKGITPESEDPKPKAPESSGPRPTTPTELTTEEYHTISDRFMDNILHHLEQLQEARADVDVEFSVSILPTSFFLQSESSS
jgi:frataxin